MEDNKRKGLGMVLEGGGMRGIKYTTEKIYLHYPKQIKPVIQFICY